MTAILVMGTGRSGTSAVAGCLYHLGVWMGDGFNRRDHNNPWGTYEDAELFRLTRQIMSGIEPPDAYREPLEKRAERELWGWKDPALMWTVQHALPFLGDDVRIVVATRPKGQCIASARKAYSWPEDIAKNWYNAAHAQLWEFLNGWEGPLLQVEFSGLLEEPRTVVKVLDEFAGTEATNYRIGKAARSVHRG